MKHKVQNRGRSDFFSSRQIHCTEMLDGADAPKCQDQAEQRTQQRQERFRRATGERLAIGWRPEQSEWAISFCRLDAFTKCRFATLAQAMSRTNPMAPVKTSKVGLMLPVICSCIGTIVTPQSLVVTDRLPHKPVQQVSCMRFVHQRWLTKWLTK